MKTKILQNVKAIILGLIVALGMGYAGAQTFTGPACGPEGACNTPAPLNVGLSPQTKTGPLTLLHLFSPDFTLTNSDGSVTDIPAGSLMVSNGANTGKAEWATSITVVEDYGPGVRCPTNGTFYDPGGSAGAGFDFTYSCNNNYVKFFSTDNRTFATDGTEIPRPKIKGVGNTGQFYAAYDTGANLFVFTVDASGYLTKVCRNHTTCPGTASSDDILCNWTGAYTGGSTTFYCNSNKLYSISTVGQGTITPSTPYVGVTRNLNIVSP